MSHFCKHYQASADHKECKVGIPYETVYTQLPNFRPPCWSKHGQPTCAAAIYQTQAEEDAELAEVSKAFMKFAAAIEADSGFACPVCGQTVESKRQIGRCVYAEPCGDRLYQGRLKK